MDDVEKQCAELLKRRGARSVGGFDWGPDDPGGKGKGKRISEWMQLSGFIDAAGPLGLKVDPASKKHRDPPHDKPDAELTCDAVRWGVELTELCCPTVRKNNRRILNTETSANGSRSIFPEGWQYREWTSESLQCELAKRVRSKDEEWQEYETFPVNCVVFSTDEIGLDPSMAEAVIKSMQPIETIFVDRAFFVMDYHPGLDHPCWELPIRKRRKLVTSHS